VFHRAIEDMPYGGDTGAEPRPDVQAAPCRQLPGFSPDGRQIVCANGSFRVAGTGTVPPVGEMAAPTPLFVMDGDGRLRRLLYADPREPALGAAWSPTGDRIAFGVGVNQPRPGQFGPAWISTIRPDGTGLRRLTMGDGNQRFPRWSPAEAAKRRRRAESIYNFVIR
jgi:hypothetical protein